MPDPNRTYNKEEIAVLLERTAQLQAEDARADNSSSQGLSLSELESIAREAGLAPEYLHRAALEIESAGTKGFQKRTKTHVHTQRYLPSEWSEELWEEFVFELRRSFGASLDPMAGTVEQIGRSREWRHTSSLGVQTSVLLRPYKEGTRIEMSQLVGQSSPKAEAVSYGTILALIPALIVAGTMGKSLVIGAISLVAFMAVLIPLIYFLDIRWRDKKLTNLDALANRLVKVASEKAALVSPGLKKETETKASRILDLEEDATAPTSVQTHHERRMRS